MEADVFPESAVAGLLKKHFVELRMHVENQYKEESMKQKFIDFREEIIAGDLTQPTYVVLNPNTRETLDLYQLEGTDVAGWRRDFFAMLDRTLAESNRGE